MSTQLSSIQIGQKTFTLDHRYQLILDLVASQFQDTTEMIDMIFSFNDKREILALIKQTMAEGCDDVATILFFAMVYQNYGENRQAEALVIPMYKRHKNDLLAKCAYAYLLLFRGQPQKIIDAFDNTLDLTQLYPATEPIPLITFLHFMSLGAQYFNAINDWPNYQKAVQYMVQAAPDHSETMRNVEQLRALVIIRGGRN